MEPTAYDKIPYPSAAHERTNPSRIAAVLAAMGYEAPPLATASILDLGCGDGLNPLTIASLYPHATVLGTDLSPVQVEIGEALRQEAGITNARIEIADVFTMPLEGQQFDYVIIHGVYSWVPEIVAQQMLKVVAARLKPGGVAFISFDTHPIGPIKEALREFLLMATEHLPDPFEKLEMAREIIEALLSGQAEDSPYSGVLALMVRLYGTAVKEFAVHDILSECHRSLSSMQFETECNTAGLMQLGDTVFGSVFTEDLKPPIQAMLEHIGTTPARKAMVIDHLRGRLFRTALVCRSDQPPVRYADEHPLDRLWFSSLTGKNLFTDPHPNAGMTSYKTRSGSELATKDPDLMAVLDCFRAHWPREMAMDEIVAGTGLPIENVRQALRHALGSDVAAAYADPPMAATAEPEFPRLSALNRALARRNIETIYSTRMTNVQLTDAGARLFASKMDGTRSADDLAAIMAEETGEPADVPKAKGGIRWLYGLQLMQP